MPLNNNATLKTTIDGFENLKNVVNNNRIALRDKLEDRGVGVSENEKLSSLIGKIDDLKALDIISDTKLPSTGKEGQICVITDNPIDKYTLTFDSDDLTSENMISLCYDSPSRGGTPYSITLKNLMYQYYFTRVLQGIDRKESYYYSNGAWHILTKAGFDIMMNGRYVNSDVTGTFHLGSAIASFTDGTGLTMGSYNTYDFTSLTKTIDFSQYNTVTFTAYGTTSLPYAWIGCFKQSQASWSGSSPTAGTSSSNLLHHKSSRVTISSTPKTYTVDISSWSSVGYFGIIKGETAQKFVVTDISVS